MPDILKRSEVMLPANISEILDHLVKSLGLPPVVLAGLLGIYLAAFVLGLLVIYKVRSIKKELSRMNRSLYLISQKLTQPPPGLKEKPQEIQESKADPQQDQPMEPMRTQQTRPHWVQKDRDARFLQAGPQQTQKPETGKNAEAEHADRAGTRPNKTEIGRKIIDRLKKTNRPITYHEIAKYLASIYAEYDYDSALTELDQLEKAGKIQGHVVAGKLYFKLPAHTDG
jgi:hypothetical protein